MKLLFDQNISFRVVKKIIHEFPLAVSVWNVGLYEEDDFPIWEYAKDNGYTIVTQDSDFDDLNTLRGHPPKIIMIRTGNISNTDLAKLMILRKDKIEHFINNSNRGRLEINHIEIIQNNE
jgi:predicted nuclease of predicted toxin-antitoxin system